jgi:hypothetical protein
VPALVVNWRGQPSLLFLPAVGNWLESSAAAKDRNPGRLSVSKSCCFRLFGEPALRSGARLDTVRHRILEDI